MPGVLVLHGFTATAREVEPLADHLRSLDFQVESPTLPGHGTTPSDLQTTTWRDWYRGAEAALDRLAEPRAVCGLSMGGLLALRLAALRLDVRAVCAIATPMWLRKHEEWAIRLLAPLVPCFPKAGPDLSDPVERRAHVGYRVFPARATASLLDLMSEVRQQISRVHVPALIVHSKRDHAAPVQSAQWLAKHLSNSRLVLLERSFHIVTRDVERETVAHHIGQFLKETLR